MCWYMHPGSNSDNSLVRRIVVPRYLEMRRDTILWFALQKAGRELPPAGLLGHGLYRTLNPGSFFFFWVAVQVSRERKKKSEVQREKVIAGKQEM